MFSRIVVAVDAPGQSQPALGLFDDPPYQTTELTLAPGDFVMLFTDGLVEACNRDDEEFGEERLVGIARENRGGRADDLERLVIQAALEHCGGHFQDDASLIVLRAV